VYGDGMALNFCLFLACPEPDAGHRFAGLLFSEISLI
jgi:hypothetical protein